MFKIESYITPIIIKYVEKYVKNIRPQELQLSMWGGEVSFQNLDLRLDVLEEELDLPFNFLSGHIHEIIIKLPWTKIASESVTVTINTIEFVLKLKDQNDRAAIPKKKEKKKKMSRDDELQTPPGYMANLINKIVNNISIKCNNVILKYIEEDIVVSMNIQQVSFDAADDFWNPAFVDTPALKVLLRKIISIKDLTICLDKRNASGKIEVCQEPILYRTTFEIRLLRKYNVATVHRSSIMRIDVHTKALHINISTQQFPMIMRLLILMHNLKQGKLKKPSTSGHHLDHNNDDDLDEENNESLFMWAWNMLPSFFPSDDDDDDDEDIKGHVIHTGMYVDKFKISFKSQEMFGDPIVYATKKIKYVPFLKIVFSGIYGESIMLGKRWFNMRGGVTNISIDSVNDCTCGAKQESVSIFTTYNNQQELHYQNTLMDSESEENLDRIQNYIFNWESHMANVVPEELLKKTPALAFDMVHQVEIPEDYGPGSEVGSDLEYSNLSEKTLYRVMVGPFKFAHSPTLVHIIDTIQEYIKLYDYPPYVDKPLPNLSQLIPPSTDDYEALMAEIPLLMYDITILNSKFEMVMCDHKKQIKKSATKMQTMPKNRNKINFAIEIERTDIKIISPLYPNRLVYTTCQLPKPPANLFEACFNKLTVDVINISLNATCNDIKVNYLSIPTIKAQLKQIIRPDLWIKEDIQEILANLLIPSIKFHSNRPRLAILQIFLAADICTAVNPSLIADLTNKSLVTIEINLNDINIKAIQNKILYSVNAEIRKCSGNDKQYLFLSALGDEPFVQLVVQLPKSLDKISSPPVILFQLSELILNLNSNIMEFLNWTIKSEDVELVTIEEEFRDVESTPKKITVEGKIIKKFSNKLDSVHSSSEKDTATIVVKPEPVKSDPVKSDNPTDWFKIISLLNLTILNVELKPITIYTTSNDFKSTTDITLANVLLTYPESDVVILKLPEILMSSLHLKSNLGYLNQKIPVAFPPAVWNKDRDGFPWNMAIKDFSVLTVQNLTEYVLINSIKTNISFFTLKDKSNGENKLDEPLFSVFLHIDTLATTMNLYENQLKLLLSTLNSISSLQIFRSSTAKSHEKPPPLEIAQRPVSPDSTVDLKEFLGISHIAESIKDSVTVVESQKLDDEKKIAHRIPFLMQWTLTKFSIVLFCSTDTDNYKFAIEFEDIISSIDQQTVYTKLKAKIGSVSGEFYQKSAVKDVWNLNESFGFNIRADQNSSTDSNNNTFFDMTMTRAETSNVHSKWGTNKRDRSLNDYLTEIMVNMQQIDIRIEFELMAKFSPILNVLSMSTSDAQHETQSDETIKVISVNDIPLIYFESKGIRLFIPTENNNKNCNVCIIKINQITISPNVENPVTRIPVRPDVYMKAAQLRILNARGSKIEDRQYELLLKGISMATGNWKELSTFMESHNAANSLHDNPAFEWNNKQNVKHTLDINTVFKDFDFSVIYAPAIIYRNVLVCGPGLELNCLTDLVIDLNSPQINLGSVILKKIALLSTHDCPTVRRSGSFDSNNVAMYTAIKNETNLLQNSRLYAVSSEYVSCENLQTDSGIGSQKNEKRTKYSKKFTIDSGADKTKKSSIVPYEMWFVGGVFTLKLYHVQNRKVKKESDTIFFPILNVSIHQPNAMITQTVFERTVQMSVFDVKICFGSDPELLKKTNNKFADVLFQTKQGDLDSHGIPQPLIKVRVRNNLIRDSELEVELKRPIKLSFSHKIIEKLHSLQLICAEFSNSETVDACPNTLRPINNNFKMKTIRSKMNGIKRFKFCTSQVLLKIARPNEYDLSLSFVKLQTKLELLDRPEKLSFNLLLKGLIVNTNDCIILHPFTLDVHGNIFQEIWNKHPSIFFTLNSNCLQIDICQENILNILKLKHSFLKSLQIFDRKTVVSEKVVAPHVENSKTLNKSNANYIQIQTPKLIRKSSQGAEEYYQDDLRAGAFQFIEANSETDMPLPYQILIINVKDNGIISWRYPQPRTLNHIKVYPVPFHTTTGINIKCRLEYFSEPHSKFLPHCDFELSEAETKVLELPQRKVASAIWRVIMIQSLVAVNSEYFNDNDTDDLENDLLSRKSRIKNIDEILMKSTQHTPEDYLDDNLRETIFHLHPKALVACMQVDSCFNPILVPNIQTVISISHIRLNLMSNVKRFKNPKIFKNYQLTDDIPQSHLFFTTYMNNFKLHMNMFDDMNISIHSELDFATEIIDYSFLTMQSLIDNFYFQMYIELGDEIVVNLMTSDIKFRYGPSIGHTLSVAEQLWRQILTSEHDSQIILTRFVVCNETIGPLRFGQAGTEEILFLPSMSCCFYAFRSEGFEQKLTIFSEAKGLAQSDAIDIGADGVQYVHFQDTNKYFIIKTEKVSTSQKKITIKGQVEFLNMTMHDFQLSYCVENDVESDFNLNNKSTISIFGLTHNQMNQTIRIKMPDNPKGWSGPIPLKKSGNNNVPWLVKVPTTTSQKFISFWIRVVREDFPDANIKPNTPLPQRILVTIWPLFMVRSLLTVDALVSMREENDNVSITIPGKGLTKELTLTGTHEDDHELIFQTHFSSPHGEDKQRALLSYKLVDKNKFFAIPNKFDTIDKILEELQKPIENKWPCSREDELRWNREISKEEMITPVYNCSLSQDLSCTLMLNILPWCLFINSTCTNIKLTNLENGNTGTIDPNTVSMPFMISTAFTVSIYEASLWKTSPTLYFKPPNLKSKQNEEYHVIPDEGNTSITILTAIGNSKLVLTSTNENGMKIITLSTYYVITNFTKYQLSAFLYSIHTDEKQELQLPTDSSSIGVYNLPPNGEATQNCVGTPISNFCNLSANKTNLKYSRKHSYFASITFGGVSEYSCPINITSAFNRKSICIMLDNRPVPLSMSLIEYNEQMYLSVYYDNSPAMEIINMTNLRLYVAQSDTVQPHGNALGLRECLGENFNWYQIIGEQSRIYYTSLGIDNLFPEIKTNEIAILFGLVTDTNTIHWSQPIELRETKNIFLKIPQYGDVKVIVDFDSKITKLYIQHISETQEFCVRDIRSRLVNRPITNENAPPHSNSNQNNDNSHTSRENLGTSESASNLTKLQLQKCEEYNLPKVQKNIRINCYLNNLTVVLFNDLEQKLSLKSEIVSINFDNIVIGYDRLENFLNLNIFNFQVDNLRYQSKLYDFPVILCAQQNITKKNLNNNNINIFSLNYNSDRILKGKQLLNFFIKFYQNDAASMKIESIKVNLNPIRAYLEDTFLNYAVDFILECLPNNLIYNDNSASSGDSDDEFQHRIKLINSHVILIPQIIEKQSLSLSETFKLKTIKIETLSILLSVHTSVRMYIALDHSPLQFSAFERHNLNTLPMKLGYVLGKHYLEGAAIGAGWVVGSLEILGSPSGLARSFTIGLRDFVSMPVQGLFRGPWGFLVGLTQGSASLIRNVTAGTVNSVSKLAASVSRNLDWLTHDEEHLMITDSIRRSRPQGVTEGFTQGLTGLGISLLGAVGGLARHPLEATSTAGVFAGVGKGIVGAFAKPISGAAELVALTGQGVLQSVGYNTLPIPRSLPSIKSSSLQPAICKLSWKLMATLLANDHILFSSLVTLKSKNGYKSVLLCLTQKIVTFLSIGTDEIIEILSIEKIKPYIDVHDPTLIILKPVRQVTQHLPFDAESMDGSQLLNDDLRSLFVSPRTYQFVRDSNEQLTLHSSNAGSQLLNDLSDIDFLNETQTVDNDHTVEFFIDQNLGEYFIRYLSIVNRCFGSNHILYSPLDDSD